MDKKQFDLFQTSVQWVWDEHQRKIKTRDTSGPYNREVSGTGLKHMQGLWVGGKVADKIKARWGYQEKLMNVVCPTACCLAGHMLLTHGDTFVVEDDGEWGGEITTSVEYCLDDKNQMHNIQNRATELAGITHEEASLLFEGGNDPEFIVFQAKLTAAKYGYNLEVV